MRAAWGIALLALGLLLLLIAFLEWCEVDDEQRGGRPMIRPSFRCPKCGSSYFRSTIVDGVTVTGHCKGRYLSYGVYTGCDFEWPRAEDHKVFLKEEEDHGEE